MGPNGEFALLSSRTISTRVQDHNITASRGEYHVMVLPFGHVVLFLFSGKVMQTGGINEWAINLTEQPSRATKK